MNEKMMFSGPVKSFSVKQIYELNKQFHQDSFEQPKRDQRLPSNFEPSRISARTKKQPIRLD
jgi:hypothetical protein